MLGISTSTFYPLYMEKAFDKIIENNIKTVEVVINSPCELNDSYLKEIKKKRMTMQLILFHYIRLHLNLNPYFFSVNTAEDLTIAWKYIKNFIML